MVRQPWKLMSILWPAVIAAVMPLGLKELVACLPAIADQLDRDHSRCGPTQIVQLRRTLGVAC